MALGNRDYALHIGYRFGDSDFMLHYKQIRCIWILS